VLLEEENKKNKSVPGIFEGRKQKIMVSREKEAVREKRVTGSKLGTAVSILIGTLV
jgi:hypothetical protein